MTWPTKKLGELVDFLDNQRKPINDEDRQKRVGSYPYYGANGQVDWIDDFIFDEDLVLLAEDGGYFGSKDRPIAYRISGKSWVNNHAHVLRVKRGIAETGFIHYRLMFYDIKPYITGSTRTKLNKSAAEKIKIPLPPLEIQKQIVERLDKIAEAQRLNDGLIQKTDELFQSLLQKELDPAEKNWEEDKFVNCIKKNPLKIKGIPREKYQSIGKFPIIDQSEKFIVGYMDDENKVYKIDSPVIIFGDHTRIFKYVDFNFAIGADGTQIIIPNPKKFIQKFFYFLMLNLKINNLGYSRHFKLLKTKKLIIPPLQTQKQIVAKLSAVQSYKKELLEQKIKIKELFESALHRAMTNK